MTSLPRHLRLGLLLLPSWICLAWTIARASWFWNHRPDLEFGWILILLCAFLTWEAWEQHPAIKPRWSVFSVTLGVAGVALLWWIQVYQAAFGVNAASMCGLALACQICITANLLHVFGMEGVKCFAFGFAFLLIAMPLPSAVQGPLISTLQGFIASVNVEVLNIIGIPARRVGSLIQLPSGTVGVDEACSGIRSLQSTVMATLFISRLSLQSRGLRGTLFVCGIGLAVFGNVLRSLFLSYTANARGIDAVNTVHDAAGWSILAFTAVGVGVLGWFLATMEKRMKVLEQERKACLPSV